jgi:hypothetical protein
MERRKFTRENLLDFVASARVRDLLLRATHLFVAARTVGMGWTSLQSRAEGLSGNLMLDQSIIGLCEIIEDFCLGGANGQVFVPNSQDRISSYPLINRQART